MANSEAKTDWKSLAHEATEDRRKGKRINLRFEIEVSGKDSKGADYRLDTFTRDVSEKGCCFTSPREMALGESISMGVIHRNSKSAVEIMTPVGFTIAWVVRDKTMWIVGAEITEVAKPWGVSFPQKSAIARLP
jgi:hypothetical protein